MSHELYTYCSLYVFRALEPLLLSDFHVDPAHRSLEIATEYAVYRRLVSPRVVTLLFRRYISKKVTGSSIEVSEVTSKPTPRIIFETWSPPFFKVFPHSCNAPPVTKPDN